MILTIILIKAYLLVKSKFKPLLFFKNQTVPFYQFLLRNIHLNDTIHKFIKGCIKIQIKIGIIVIEQL